METRPLKMVSFTLNLLIGGDKGIRTPDLCSAIAALYQLSYIPKLFHGQKILARFDP